MPLTLLYNSVMFKRMERRFPIAELKTLVARVLNEGNYSAPVSGRVRAVPDTRTIRYYTTLGLIDGPAQMVGRTAFYGERHVLQIVAIKRLQAANKTLSDIQQHLVGITHSRLRQIAELPDRFWETAEEYLTRQRSEKNIAQTSTPSVEGVGSFGAANEAFWAIKPTRAATPVEHSQQAWSTQTLRNCLKLSLGFGVELTLDTNADSTPAHENIDLQRLVAAVGPFFEELARQGLVAKDRPIADADAASVDPENESSQS